MIDQILFGLVSFAVVMLVAYLAGGASERRHLRDLERRELAMRALCAVTLGEAPSAWHVKEARMVVGSVVIAFDPFKRLLASLRKLVGGSLRSYEPLLERARREAMLRMKELAHARGYHAVIRVRLESCPISNALDEDEISGVEMIAYGTALRLREPLG